MNEVVRYRLVYLTPDESGLRYSSATKEFRALRQLLEFVSSLPEGATIHEVQKWTKGVWSDQEKSMIKFWLDGADVKLT